MVETVVEKLAKKDTPGSEQWGDKIRRRARTLTKTIEQGYMELGEILYTVYDTPINGDPKNGPMFQAWGYTTFAQWVENDLGLHKRKAERLRNIWYNLNVRLGKELTRQTRRRIIALGWCKCRELVRVLSAENVEQWVEMAERLKYPELTSAIRKALKDHEQQAQERALSGEDDEEGPEYPDPPDDVEEWTERAFYLAPEQLKNVEAALDRAKQLSHSKSINHNLDLICMDFLATNEFRLKDDPKMALRFLVKFEKLTGKRLIIIDPVTKQIEYGIEALEMIAGEDDDG